MYNLGLTGRYSLVTQTGISMVKVFTYTSILTNAETMKIQDENPDFLVQICNAQMNMWPVF